MGVEFDTSDKLDSSHVSLNLRSFFHIHEFFKSVSSRKIGKVMRALVKESLIHQKIQPASYPSTTFRIIHFSQNRILHVSKYLLLFMSLCFMS
jgi:hypothetical protein